MAEKKDLMAELVKTIGASALSKQETLDAISKSVDFGIEKESKDLKPNEMLSVKITKHENHFKVNVRKVPKDK